MQKISGDSPRNYVPTKRFNEEIQIINAPDSFSLLLNYPDPFLKDNQPVRKWASINIRKKNSISFDWSFITYNGLIKNSNSKKRIGLINFRGKELMVTQGQNIEKLKIIEILPDSMKISFKGKIKYIKRRL